MNVPNVVPNMPMALPGMPNAAPGAPMAMQSQQAGKVQLGCAGCKTYSFKGLSPMTWPMWAKITGGVALVGVGVGLAAILVRR